VDAFVNDSSSWCAAVESYAASDVGRPVLASTAPYERQQTALKRQQHCQPLCLVYSARCTE
jgi:hypothetical protein